MINHNEKVSVLISIYNGEPYIKKSLKSILEQSYKNIEVLIIDDGSTDQTSKICKSYQDNDSRIKLFRNETNIGLTKSLNIGSAALEPVSYLPNVLGVSKPT